MRRARGRHRKAERGYVLITLMLFVMLLSFALLTVETKIEFQARRDREEELLHRGVQYARAIRLYFRKLGRYPTRIEELESTNNLRFLRKRYKDPITGEDFKILRQGDVKLTFGQGIAGAMTPQAMAAAAQGGPQAAQAMAAAAAMAQQAATPTATLGSQNPSDQTAQNPTDSSSGENTGTTHKSDKSSSGGLSGPTFGGGPILGVASTSSKESIREFNKKNHYDQWQFIYDPSLDRGGLLNAPAQPPLQGVGQTTGTTQTGMPQPGTPGGMNPVQALPTNPQPQTPQENPQQN